MKKQLAITAILLSTLLSCTSEKATSISTDTVEVDTTFISGVQQPIADTITPTITETSNAPQSNQINQQGGCDFESARKKALEKVTKLNFSFVDDEFPADKNIDDCSINFHFYVKKITYDLDGNPHIQDKVFELKLDYRKIGADFEFIDGRLFEVNSNKYQVIN